MIKVFIVEDDEFFGQLVMQSIQEHEDIDAHLYKDTQSFLRALPQSPEIVIADYDLPDGNGLELLKKIEEANPEISTIILSGQKTLEVVVDAYKLGAKSYIIKNENALVELNHNLKNLKSNIRLKKEVITLKSELIDRNQYSRIKGESDKVINVLKLIRKVQDTNLLALVTGESGTGKELVAKAIHYNSSRKKKPFITVNIAAIPEDLIESELFGHEKGAFTGASGRRIGKFEEASNGTLFLDEIGEMDIDMQVKLLRVLQENTITRLGSNKEIKLNTRLVAATNKNLSDYVKQGKFRQDLYYRLQGFPIHLPPLRERANDVILLARHFLVEFCKKNKVPEKTIAQQTINVLMEHKWPGNIRELKAIIERSVLIAEGDTIEEDHLIFSESAFEPETIK